MGDKARRKERQRLKRRQKRHSMHRAEGMSPYRKFAAQGEILACYVNEGWQEDGIAEVLVLKRVSGGNMAFAAFLVDVWCIGLKDAWGRINASRSDFDDLVGRARENFALMRIDAATAWRIVSGGVRFSRQNGFRLPPRYERWTSLLGNNAECASADLSDFGTEDGKLRYVGSMEDLQRRLIGSRPEEFLQREDVEHIIGDPQWDREDDDEYEDFEGTTDGDDELDLSEDEIEDRPDLAEIQEAIAQFEVQVLDAVRKWCFANGLDPHPRLPEAVGLSIASILHAAFPAEEPEDGDGVSVNDNAKNMMDRINTVLSLTDAEESTSLQEALDQMAAFSRQFGSFAEFLAATGMEYPGPKTANEE